MRVRVQHATFIKDEEIYRHGDEAVIDRADYDANPQMFVVLTEEAHAAHHGLIADKGD